MKTSYTRLRRGFSGGESGFTLVELLVSLAIIGILAGAVVLRINGPAEASPPEDPADSITAESVAESAVLKDIDGPSLLPDGLQAEAALLADRMEYRIVQTALDTMMVRNGITSVVETGFTDDMSAFPAGRPLYPQFLREQHTRCRYSCDSTGMITQSK